MGFFTALALGTTGLSLYSQVKAGGQAKRAGQLEQRAAESEAVLSEFNAAVAQAQAEQAIARGAAEESTFRSGVRGLIGTQRAGLAAGNVDVGFGSALDVQADTAYLGELDALTIRNNASLEAWGYKVQAEDFRQRATIQRHAGKFAAAAGQQQQTQARIGAIQTALGSAPAFGNIRGMRRKATPAGAGANTYVGLQ